MACCAERKDFCVRSGATFNPIIRWGSKVLSSAAVTAITQGTPTVVTAPGHGVPDGWPVALVGVLGMSALNAVQYPPLTSDMHDATVLDANTLRLNGVSSAMLPAYVSGGAVVFNTPQPLAGLTFTMKLWADEMRAGTPLATLTNGSGITVDSVAQTIIPLLQTAGLTWGTNVAFYDLTATDGAGVVTELFTGTLTIQ